MHRTNNKRSYNVNAFNQIESRSFENNLLESNNYPHQDFTRENTNTTSDFDNSIRLASLRLAAKNIFKDIVLRPINGFARFFKTAATIWDKKV